MKLGAYSILRKENRDGVKFFLDAPKNGNGADPWVFVSGLGTERYAAMLCGSGRTRAGRRILATGERFVRQG